MPLKINYKDDIFEGNRKYNLISNADGTVSLVDATTYQQEGSIFGALDINDTNVVVNSLEFDVKNSNYQEIYSTGITSLPSTAQSAPFNELILQGRTATNLVKNGNFANGTTGWTFNAGSVYSVTNNELVFTSLASTAAEFFQNISTVVNNKYYVSTELLSNSNLDGMWFLDSSTPNSATRFAHSGSNGFQRLSRITISTNSSMVFRPLDSSRSGDISTNPVKSRRNIIIDLTSTFGAGNEPTVEECDRIFANYFDGTQSVGEVEVKVTGKNLFDGQLESGTYSAASGQKAAYASTVRTVNKFPVKENTEYTLSSSVYNLDLILFYDSVGKFISVMPSVMRTRTFTTPTGCRKIAFSLNTTKTDTRVQLEQGTVATPYEHYTETTTTTPPIGNSLPNGIKDTFEVVSGIKTQNVSNPKISTSYDSSNLTKANVDVFRIFKAPDIADSIDLFIAGHIYNKQNCRLFDNVKAVELTEVGETTYDNADNIGKYFVNTNGVWLVCAKGTTPTINHKLIYQLAQPIITQYDTEVLLSQPNGTVIPSTDGIYPSMKIKYANNTKAVIESNTKTLVNLDRGKADALIKKAKGTATSIILDNISLTDGFCITFIASASNSGNATTINGKPLYKPGTTTAPKIIAGKAITVWYDTSGGCFFSKASAEGTAVAGDVLAGKTFSNDEDIGLVGTIPSKSSQTYTPTTADQTIAAMQYLSGIQTIKGDSNLVQANVLSGKSIFGVAGTAKRTVSGTASLVGNSNNYGFGYPLEIIPLSIGFTPTRAFVWVIKNGGNGLDLQGVATNGHKFSDGINQLEILNVSSTELRVTGTIKTTSVSTGFSYNLYYVLVE